MKSTFKKYDQEIAKIIPASTVEWNEREDFVTISVKGKRREFTVQLIAQLPNESVRDYIYEQFTGLR